MNIPTNTQKTKSIRNRRRFKLEIILTSLFYALAASAFAAGPYYWDCNSSTAGFGTAQGSWSATTVPGATQGWSVDSTGGSALSSVTTDASDSSENFGTALAGLAAGTVTVSGTVSSGPIIFGGTSGAIILSGGTITLPASAVISGTNASDTISSILSGGSTSLTYVGSATNTLILSGANTYGGSTVVSGGRLSVGSSALPAGSVVTVTNGGQLYFNTGGYTIGNNFNLSSLGYNDNGNNSGAIRLTSGDNLTGTITLVGNSRVGFVAGAASGTISGQITGNYSIDFYGIFNVASTIQTFTLANTGAPNNYTGNTYLYNNYFSGSSAGNNAILKLGASEQIPNGVGKGILVLNGFGANRLCTFELNGFNETINGVTNTSPGSLFNVIQNTAAGASTLTIGDGDTTSGFGGNILDGGTGKTLAIAKIGAGAFTLSGSNSYAGGVTLNAGTLNINCTNALGSGAFTISGGAIDNTSSAAISNINNNAQSWNGDFTFSGTAALNLGVGAVTLGASRQVKLNANTLTIGGVIGGGAVGLTVSGPGTLALNGANTYSGGTIITNSGTVAVGNSACFGAGIVTVAQGSYAYNFSKTALTFNNAVTLNGGQLHTGGGNSGTKNIWAGPVTLTASSSVQADGGTTGNAFTGGLNMGNGGYTLTVGGNGNNAGSANNFNSVISGGPNATLLGSPGSAIYLNAANTYSGTVRSGSSLVLQNVNALQNATLDMNAADVGTVTYINNAVIGALTGSRDLNLGGNTILIGNNNASTAFSGGLTNSGALTKIGSGTLTLSGVCTYPGATTVKAGALALIGTGSLASSLVTVFGGATLDASAGSFNLASGQVLSNSASATAILAGPISTGSGTVSVSFVNGTPCFNIASGTLTLSAATILNINNTGAALAPGTYKIISSSGSGAVAGAVPALVSVVNGPPASTYSLAIVSGELYLTVGGVSLTLSSSLSPSGYLSPVQFTASLSPTNATGSVTFSQNGLPISTNPIVNGSAVSDSISTLARGTNAISAAYLGDPNYAGSTNVFSQVVTNHPPVAAPMTITRQAGLNLTIRLSDIATNWSDVDSDGILLTNINFVTTNGVDMVPLNVTTKLDGSYVVSNTASLGYSSSSSVNDQLSYTVTDNQGGVATGLVNIVVSTVPVFGQQSPRLAADSSGHVQVTFYGVPGSTYIIQRSPDLNTWTDISSNTATTGNPVLTVTDVVSPNGQAYYRLEWQP